MQAMYSKTNAEHCGVSLSDLASHEKCHDFEIVHGVIGKAHMYL